MDELISIAQILGYKNVEFMQILKALLFHNPIHELSTQAIVEQQAAFKQNQ